jgi:RHS repeat-associated protein
MRNRFFVAILLISASLTATNPLCAQTLPPVITDQVLGGTGGDFEKIDLSNGGVNLSIPIYRIKGRGIDDFFTVNYTSKVFFTVSSGQFENWAYNSPWSAMSPRAAGGRTSTAIIDYCTWHPTGFPPIQEPITAHLNEVYTFPDGSSKNFPYLEIDLLNCDTPPQWVNYTNAYSSDLSGTMLNFAVLRNPDGTTPTSDSNGNNESSTNDSAGRNLPTSVWSGGNTILTITLIDGRQIVLHYGPVAFATAFVNPSRATNTSGNMAGMLNEIDLPNGTSWKFQYATNSYGQLLKVTLPTGGYIRYTYAVQTKFATDMSPGFPAALEDALVVTGRYVSSDGITEQGETYGYTASGGKVITQRTVTKLKPTGDQEIHIFQPMDSFQTFKETDAQYYQGTTKNLREVLTAWACDTLPTSVGTTPPSGQGPGQTPGSAFVGLGAGNCKVSTATTMLFDGQSALTRTVKYQYDQSLSDSYPSQAYLHPTYAPYTATFGNVTQTLESDWGVGGTPGTPSGPGTPGTAGPLLRETDITYMTTNPQNGNIDYRSPLIHIVNKPILKIVKDGQGNIIAQTSYQYDGSALTDTSGTPAPQHDYTNFPKTNLTRGNLTQTSRWLKSSNTWLSTNNIFDDLGNLRSQTDPSGNVTSYSYVDNYSDAVNRSSQAYVTQVTRPATGTVNHISSEAYYYATALPYQNKDENELVTTYTYDNMNRPSSIQTPDGGQAANSYQDVSPFSVTTTTKITGTLNKISTTILDGLGRTSQTQLTSDPDGVTYVDTSYDSLGRTASVSNPYRSKTGDPTYGVTGYVYDPLGRVCVVIPPDGTAVSGNTCPATAPARDLFTKYSGNSATASDQASKSRKSVTDGLGRLTQVFEDPSGLNYESDYAYDALDNLLTVNQKGASTNSVNWRTRTFTYDSLSRLLTAANPESGNATYSYNPDGTLATKIAPAPNQTGSTTVTTTYTYDALHRLTQKSFSDSTPTAKYGYDAVPPTGCTLPTLTIGNGIGKRTGMCDAAGAEAWSYDITAGVGWKLTDVRTTNGVTKSTVAQNNLAGSVTSLTYPSGRTISYTLSTSGTGTAGRLSSALDSTGPINYATGATYAPPGGLSSLANNASIVSTYFYNDRLQPCRISVKSTGTSPASCTDAAVGNVLDFSYNFSLGVSDNGNVTGIVNNRDTTRSQTFTYDSLNRISVGETTSTFATSPSHCWGEQFSYDPWGNLSAISGASSAYTGCTQEALSVTPAPNNQISGFCYDAAGNLLAQSAPPCPVPTYTYNAENQMTLTAGITYTYDGDGKRVQKSSGKLYWYGLGSDPLDETDAAGNTNNASFFEYVFFGGKRIARRDSTNAVSYYFADHLGTARIVASASGTILDDSDFYPFGGERVYTNSSPQNYKFTGKERDSESGLDDFGPRYDFSAIGRFMSPDAGPFHFTMPQSLNRYVYALNNPLRYIDPDGRDPIDPAIWDQIKRFDQIADQRARALLRDEFVLHTPMIISSRTASALRQVGDGNALVHDGGIQNLQLIEQEDLSRELQRKVETWIADPSTNIEQLKALDWDIAGLLTQLQVPSGVAYVLPGKLKMAISLSKSVEELLLQRLRDELSAAIIAKEKLKEEEEKKQKCGTRPATPADQAGPCPT